MRRRLLAASVFVVSLSLVGAPAVSAESRGQGRLWAEWVEGVWNWWWQAPAAAQQLEAETLQDGIGADPWGRTTGGTSASAPPPDTTPEDSGS
jgi:hypothetical protein